MFLISKVSQFLNNFSCSPSHLFKCIYILLTIWSPESYDVPCFQHNTVINAVVFITVSTLSPPSDVFVITYHAVHRPTGGLPNVMPHIHIIT